MGSALPQANRTSATHHTLHSHPPTHAPARPQAYIRKVPVGAMEDAGLAAGDKGGQAKAQSGAPACGAGAGGR